MFIFENRFYPFLLCFFLVIFCIADQLQADDTVYWSYFNIPPLCILHEDGRFDGIGPELGKYIQSHLPQYKHSTIAASPLKMFQSVTEGRSWVLSGVLKNTAREKKLYYSKFPCRLTWSVLAITRKDDIRFVNSQGVFLAQEALDATGYKFGYVKGVDFGNLNPLVFEHVQRHTQTFASYDFNKLMELLVFKRIDFFFADPLMAYYASLYSESSSKIDLVPCMEVPPSPLYGYYAVPKTKWGRRIIAKIDIVLEQMIRSGKHKELLLKWVPTQFNEFFVRDYKAGFEDALTKN